MPAKQKITTFLWFQDNAEAAIRFYLSVFPDGKLLSESRWGEGGPVAAGTLMVGHFQIAGQEFMALNGGPTYTLTEAVSLFVSCDSQDEIDRYWRLLGEGGEYQACGWLKDRYGLSWQIVPSSLGRLMSDPDRARAGRVMGAMMQMVKFDLAALERAASGT